MANSGRISKPVLSGLLLLALSLISFIYIIQAFRYFSNDPTTLSGFWEIRYWLYLHIVGGIFALLIGPFQLCSTFRNRFTKLHKKLGYIYVFSILISCLCSFYMTINHAFDLHWTWSFSLQCLAFTWLVTTLMAVFTVRRKQIEDHQKWMIRSYVVTFAFVSHRWLVDLPFLIELGGFVERAPTTIWVAWSIPLLACEVWFQLSKNQPRQLKKQKVQDYERI
ncbi:DUF2306 domain-containing protein [Algoriphagus namhaensis]